MNIFFYRKKYDFFSSIFCFVFGFQGLSSRMQTTLGECAPLRSYGPLGREGTSLAPNQPPPCGKGFTSHGFYVLSVNLIFSFVQFYTCIEPRSTNALWEATIRSSILNSKMVPNCLKLLAFLQQDMRSS